MKRPAGDFTVLIAEDDAVQRELLNHMIQQVGFKTLVASNGIETRGILAKHIPDLVLLDLHMADVTGFQLLKEIKSDPAKSGVYVLMMSVDSSDESAILCMSSGANGYIDKPVRLNDLAMKLSSVLKADISNEYLGEIQKVIRQDESKFADKFTPDMVNFILSDREALSARPRVTFATMLAVRISGLNDLVEQGDSLQIHAYVEELIEELVNIIYKNRGSVYTIANDTIVASFGIPVVYDTDTVNALLCADELRKLIEEKGSVLNYSTGHHLSISLGITTGKAYYGPIRASHRLNSIVMGAPVKKIFYFELADEVAPGAIIVDDNTRKAVESYAAITPLKDTTSSKCFSKEPFFMVGALDYAAINDIPNFNKQYTPKDSIGDEGYNKL